MSSVTPLIVTYPCALVRDGLRPILAKSPFRPVHILPMLNEETESYLASAGACIWLVGVNECGPTTNDLVRKVVATNPSLRAVILTASHTPNDILPAFLAGACGFLGQDIPSKHLIKSLELIALGQSVDASSLSANGPRFARWAGNSEVAAQSELSADLTAPFSCFRPGLQTYGGSPATLTRRRASNRRQATKWSEAYRAVSW